MYFELLDVIPGGHALLKSVLGTAEIPRISGPSVNVPSRLHARTVQSMMRALDVVYAERSFGPTDAATTTDTTTTTTVDGDGRTGSGFDVLNEFSGLRGIFPIGDWSLPTRTNSQMLTRTNPLVPHVPHLPPESPPCTPDAAVYHDDALVALVEIDGEFHYKVAVPSTTTYLTATLPVTYAARCTQS